MADHVASELATYIEKENNTTDDVKKVEEDTDEHKNRCDYCEMENTLLYLGNCTQRNDTATMKRYIYYWRVLLLFVVPIISSMVENYYLLHITFSCVIIILCLMACFFSFYKTSKQNNNESNKSFVHYLNFTLGIPPVNDELYDIETKYYGTAYILLCIYYNLSHLLGYNYSFFKVNFREWAEEADYLKLEQMDDVSENIIVWLEMLGSRFLFIMIGLVIVSSYYTVHPSFVSKMDDEKQKLLGRFTTTNIQSIENRIFESLKKNKIDKKARNRKLEIFFADLCVAIIYRLIVSYIIPGGLLYAHATSHDANISAGSKFMVIYMMICDIIFLSIFYFFVQSLFFYHYHFIYDIMFQLSLSIESKTINDVVAWWELRKWYQNVIVIKASGLSTYVIAALSASVCCASIGIDTIATKQYPWAITNGVTLLYCTVLVFASAELCVSYHNLQLDHVNTLNKERLKLFKSEMSKLKQTYQSEVTEKVFDVLHQDIERNDFPLSLLGVRMNANFMLFLRGLALTVIVAIIVEIGR